MKVLFCGFGCCYVNVERSALRVGRVTDFIAEFKLCFASLEVLS